MKRQGPYAAAPPKDAKGNPLPGLPPRARKPNPIKGPSMIERIKAETNPEARQRLKSVAASVGSAKTKRKVLNLR